MQFMNRSSFYCVRSLIDLQYMSLDRYMYESCFTTSKYMNGVGVLNTGTPIRPI